MYPYPCIRTSASEPVPRDGPEEHGQADCEGGDEDGDPDGAPDQEFLDVRFAYSERPEGR